MGKHLSRNMERLFFAFFENFRFQLTKKFFCGKNELTESSFESESEGASAVNILASLIFRKEADNLFLGDFFFHGHIIATGDITVGNNFYYSLQKLQPSLIVWLFFLH